MFNYTVLTERAERRAMREREQALRRLQQEMLSSLFSNTRLTPHPTSQLSWGEARSRARRLYPRSQIVDKFRELKNDMLFKPNAEGVVAVVQIKGPYPHPYRQGRCLEVRIFVLLVCVPRLCLPVWLPLNCADREFINCAGPILTHQLRRSAVLRERILKYCYTLQCPTH